MRTKNIQIGWLKLRPKALTLQQIYDAGRFFRFKSDGQISITNAIAEMLANCFALYKQANTMDHAAIHSTLYHGEGFS